MNQLYPSLNSGNAAEEDHKAALLLHALPADDRAWLLEKLPASERQALQSLLTELTELGIPADRSLLDEVMSDMPDSRAASGKITAAPGDLSMQELTDIAPAMIAKILQDEPAMLIAHLLMINDWPWTAAALEQMGVLKRRQIESCITQLSEKKICLPTTDGIPQLSALHRQLLAELKIRLSNRYPNWRVRQESGMARQSNKANLVQRWSRWLGSNLVNIGGRGNP